MHILGQTALVLYNLHRFDECLNIFEDLLTIDPYRIELMDIYSNILYVKEKRRELSYLAHRCMDFLNIDQKHVVLLVIIMVCMVCMKKQYYILKDHYN